MCHSWKKKISCRTEALIWSLVHSATFVVVLQAGKNCEHSSVKSLYLLLQCRPKGSVFFYMEATVFLQGISSIQNRLWNMVSKETQKLPTLGSVLQSPRNTAKLTDGFHFLRARELLLKYCLLLPSLVWRQIFTLVNIRIWSQNTSWTELRAYICTLNSYIV